MLSSEKTALYFCLCECANLTEKHIEARRPWLTPVILAAQETEIRRISVQVNPGK
jgi:hypothetical protein